MDVPGIEKLIEVTANGIGSVAGRMFVEWKAKKAGRAQVIAAEAEARVLQIRAQAHKEARELLARGGPAAATDVDIGETITERVRYRERARLSNIGAAVGHAATVLENKHVSEEAIDPDWTARFFNDVQDVSSAEMHVLWGRILAGEVERTGRTSLRTLGGNAAHNSLAEFGLGFPELNRLQEHGLVIGDYDSWAGYDWAVVPGLDTEPLPSFQHQGREWALVAQAGYQTDGPLKINGVSLTVAGQQLCHVIDPTPMPGYLRRLGQFFEGLNLQMRDVTDLV